MTIEKTNRTFQPDDTIVLEKQKVYIEDGVEYPQGKLERRMFVPTEENLVLVKEFAPEYYDGAKYLWVDKGGIKNYVPPSFPEF